MAKKKSETLPEDVAAILEEDLRRHREQMDLFAAEASGSAPFVRPPWFRLRTPTFLYGESRTVQSEREATDVNNVIRRYARTGEFPPNTKTPIFADVTGLQGDLTALYARSKETIRTTSEEIEAHQKRKAEKTAVDAPPKGDAPPPVAE